MVFKALDKNGDGVLNGNEVGGIFNKMGTKQKHQNPGDSTGSYNAYPSHGQQAQPLIANQGYPQPGYNQPGIHQGYPQPGYSQPGIHQGYPQPGYNQPDHQQSYPQAGYNQPGIHQGYPQPGYNQPGIQQGYPQPGYNQPGIHQGYPQLGYNQPGIQQGYQGGYPSGPQDHYISDGPAYPTSGVSGMPMPGYPSAGSGYQANGQW